MKNMLRNLRYMVPAAMLVCAFVGVVYAAVSVIRTGERLETTDYIVHRGRLLDAAVAVNTNGTWINVQDMGIAFVQIKGITSATAIVDVSIDDTVVGCPANTVHDIEVQQCTADCGVVVTYPVKCIKVRLPTYVSGTVSAFLSGRVR